MSSIMEKTKFVGVVRSQAIKDNASFVGSLDSTPVSIDTKGWKQLDIYVDIGATDKALAEMDVHESDDDSTFTAITGADYVTLTQEPSATDDNKCFRWSIKLGQSRKRYFRVELTAGNGTAGTYAVCFAFLSDPEIVPNSNSERGLEDCVYLPSSA